MTWLLLVLLLLFILLSGFFSGAETGAYRVNPVRLQLRSNAGDPAAVRLQHLLEDRQGILSVTLIGTNLANYLATVCMAALLARAATALSDREIELYTTCLLTPIIFVFGETVPKNWFRQEADLLMTRSSMALATIDRALRLCGAVATLKWLTAHLLRWWQGREDWEQAVHPRRKMISLLQEGAAEGALSEEQTKLVDRVLSLSGVSVGSVMIPLARVVALPRQATRDRVLDVLAEHPYSRYPVVETDRRRVLGVINVYDFLADPQNRSVEPCMTEPMRLEPKASVSTALHTMRRTHQPFSIVVDRWDNCIGVVTAKDVVEEIVGELTAW